MTESKRKNAKSGMSEAFEKAFCNIYFRPDFSRSDDGNRYLCDEIEDSYNIWQAAYAKGREDALKPWSVETLFPTEHEIEQIRKFGTYINDWEGGVYWLKTYINKRLQEWNDGK